MSKAKKKEGRAKMAALVDELIDEKEISDMVKIQLNKTQLRQVIQSEFNKFVNANFAIGQIVTTADIKQKLRNKKPSILLKAYDLYVEACNHRRSYGGKWGLDEFERTSRLMKKHPGYLALGTYTVDLNRGLNRSYTHTKHGIYISK